MKKNFLVIVVLLFGLISCKTKTHDPDAILSSKQIEMKITYFGCFGVTSQLVKISGEGSERRLTLKPLEGVVQPALDMKFTAEKERILSELLSNAYTLKDELPLSKSSCADGLRPISTYSIKTERHTCDDFHGDCKTDSLYKELVLP